MHLKFIYSITLIAIFSFAGTAQSLYRPDIATSIKNCEKFIYNSMPDSANVYINRLEKKLPDHPVIPMMRALTIVWEYIPMIDENIFRKIKYQLDHTIKLAKTKDPDSKKPEVYFFAMSANALLAEFYASQHESPMKIASVASNVYSYMKKGFEETEKHPQFLLTTGLYNYFRERYPEKHPIYKSVVWMFRSGDKKLGIQQLIASSKQPFMVRVEAMIYLSYIYLRFDNNPYQAQQYMGKLCREYPNNYYAKAKYLEAFANPKHFHRAPLKLIDQLLKHHVKYYQMAGYTFKGYHEEIVKKNPVQAKVYYVKALKIGENIHDHGEYFKSLCAVKVGKMLVKEGKKEEAKKMLELSLKYAEIDYLEQEAKEALSKI